DAASRRADSRRPELWCLKLFSAHSALMGLYFFNHGAEVGYETTLAQGVHFERRLFHALFATADQKEGMAAFAEKRQPNFKNR
ncbi:MAG TPA: hypothetical protein HPP80_09340, partial [Rhodospirillaceae bacterium]|nr:hypothetical protein [Rhodospirillaceae bacterium]